MRLNELSIGLRLPRTVPEREEGLEPPASRLLRPGTLATELLAQMYPAMNSTTAHPMVGRTSGTLWGSLSSSAGHVAHSSYGGLPVKSEPV